MDSSTGHIEGRTDWGTQGLIQVKTGGHDDGELNGWINRTENNNGEKEHTCMHARKLKHTHTHTHTHMHTHTHTHTHTTPPPFFLAATVGLITDSE